MTGSGVKGKMTSLPAGMMINAEENRAMFFIKLSIFIITLLLLLLSSPNLKFGAFFESSTYRVDIFDALFHFFSLLSRVVSSFVLCF
jgi:hypothetical protein